MFSFALDGFRRSAACRAAVLLPLTALLLAPAAALAQNAVLDVNQSMIGAIRATLANPVAAARDIAITDIAVYDAVNAASPAELEALLGPLVEAGVDCFDTSTRV